jgi:hypothetical protein
LLKSLGAISANEDWRILATNYQQTINTKAYQFPQQWQEIYGTNLKTPQIGHSRVPQRWLKKLWKKSVWGEPSSRQTHVTSV